MKLFEVLLSGEDKTIALVVAAETLERAETLALEEYGIGGEEADEDRDDYGDHNYGELRVYRSNEIRGVSATVEIVREIFNTNEL